MQMLQTIVSIVSIFSWDRFQNWQTWKTEIYHYCNFDKMCFERKVQLKRADDLFSRRESSMKNFCNRYFLFNASFACMQRRFFDYTAYSRCARPQWHFTRGGARQFCNLRTRRHVSVRTSFTISRALFRPFDIPPLNKANRLSIKDIFLLLHRIDMWRITFRIPDA